MSQIAIINASQAVKDDEVRKCADALQTQVNSHFRPLWGVDAELTFFTHADAAAGKIPAGSWWLAVLDDSDTAGALGYHDLSPEGLPLGKAFAGTDITNNLSWTTTVSHELLEMLGDPDINLTVLVQETKQGGMLVAYEVCDACEDDQFGYKIGDVLVSDFVTPAWFEPFRKVGSTDFDYCKKIQKPFQLLPGGYIGYMKIGDLGGWQQLTAQELSKGPGKRLVFHPGMRARVGSRRERRNLARGRWMECTVSGTVSSGSGGTSGSVTISCTL